ncbi:mCG1035987 [Mus musculus]|nr:mCG1035987 [Mus musculus]
MPSHSPFLVFSSTFPVFYKTFLFKLVLFSILTYVRLVAA